MLSNVIIGFFVMGLCLLLQSVLILAAIQFYKGHKSELDSPSMMASLKIVNVFMLLLVIGILGQIAIWAMLFQFLAEFTNFSDAFYHSAVNFSTLGYGDIVMSDEYRLLGPLQSINGILMVGVSTAALMSAYQDALKRTVRAQSASFSAKR